MPALTGGGGPVDGNGVEPGVPTLEPTAPPARAEATPDEGATFGGVGDERATGAARFSLFLSGRRVLVAAVVLGVVLRLLAAVVIGQGGEIHEFGVIGENLVTGRGYSYFAVGDDAEVVRDFDHVGRPLPSAFMPPVYTVLASGAFALTSSNEAAIALLQVFQALLAAAAIALMWWLGRTLFGPVAGGLAALAYAGYPALIYQTTQVSASNVYLLLEIAAFALLINASRHRQVGWAAAAGLALASIALLRAEGVLLVVLAGLWLAWSRRRAQLPIAAACAVLVAIGLVFPAMWTARNAVVLDRVIPTLTTSGGLNLWLGNAEGATGGIGEPPMTPELQAALDAVPADDSYEVGRDEAYRAAALEDMADDPVGTVAGAARKVALMLTVDLNDDRARNPLAIIPWLVLAVLGVLGIVRVPLARDLRVLLLGYVAVTLAIAAGFFALGRFKLAIEYPMMLFAAGYLATVLQRWVHPRQG